MAHSAEEMVIGPPTQAAPDNSSPTVPEATMLATLNDELEQRTNPIVFAWLMEHAPPLMAQLAIQMDMQFIPGVQVHEVAASALFSGEFKQAMPSELREAFLRMDGTYRELRDHDSVEEIFRTKNRIKFLLESTGERPFR